MTVERSVVPILAVLLFASAGAGGAQAPTRDSTAVAMSIQRLPVLDYDGNVIPEDSIAAVMRPGGRILRPLLGALVGLIAFTATNQPGFACDIYDPCTPREKWRRDVAPVTGLFVGLMVGIAIPNGSVSRSQAVELIRSRRRADKAAQK